MKAKHLLLSILLAGTCLAGCDMLGGNNKTDPDIVVEDKTLQSVSAEGLEKTTYYVGDEFDSTGLKVYANYSDGTKEIVTAGSYTVSGFNSSVAGTTTVTITYNGKTTTINLSVVEPKVASIEVTGPTKKQYQVGEQLDTTGMSVTATLENSEQRPVAITDCEITGFDSSHAGECEVTVTYSGKTDKFTVTIINPTLESITVTEPTKTTYQVGEQLDTAGMVVTANYSNNTTENVAIEDCTISGFDSTIAGTNLITVTYEGFVDTFIVTIVDPVVTSIVVTAPSKSEYFIGEELDITGMSVKAYYSNATNKNVALEDCEITGFDSSVAGEVTVTVAYEEKSDSFVVTIVAPTLTGIKSFTAPSKVNYRVGESLDTNGMSIVGTYNDGQDRDIALEDCAITGFDSSAAGTKTVTVKVGEFEKTFDVTFEAAPAAIECTMSFDTADDLENLSMTSASAAVWNISQTISNSHDGVGSLKISPTNNSGKWPQLFFGKEFNLTNVAKVEMWIYAEGNETLKNMALMFKKSSVDGSQYSYYPEVAPGNWVKYEVLGSTLASKIDDLSSVDIYLGNNGSDYVNRCVFYVDSFNLVNYPAVTNLAVTINKNIRVGAELNKDDINVVATFDDDSTSVVALSNCDVTGFDSSAAGTKELTVTYKGKSTTCSYTVEEAPAAVSVTHGFDNAEDVASIPGSNDNNCWPIGFTNSISHDGVGSLKIDPDRASTTKWPKINLGEYDLSNAKSVEYWVYFDSDNAFNTFAIFASEGDTTKTSATIKVESRTWTKFSLEGSAIAAKVTDITNVRIYFAQNGGTYPDRSSIYIDSFNIINNPVVSGVTATMNKNIRVGGNLNDTNISITATYDNDETEKVSLNSCTVEGFDSSTAGTKEMTITYKGKSTTCSYTIEEAPAAVSVTNGFDSAEDVAKLPAGSSSDAWCWPRAFSNEMSHDGAGSLKVTPHKTDGSWPGMDFGAYDLTDAKKVEIWAYVDGDEGLNNIAIRLKAANTTNVYTSSKNLPARQWFKFEVDMSTVTATPEQLANMNIWVFQNNSTYTNRCPIYFDSLNIDGYPATVSVTKSFDTADDVTNLPAQTSDDAYAWSLSHSTEKSHDGRGSLKITPLNRGTTWPALNLGAYDLSNVRKIELWAYADSDDDLPNMRLRLKLGTTVEYDLTKTLVGHQWVKYEVLMSETGIAAADLSNLNIWFYHSGSSYTNKCPIYVDSLNLVEYPAAVSVTQSFDTANDVANLPEQNSDNKYAWSLSYSTEQSHDGVGALKATSLNRGTTWPGVDFGAYDLTNVSKIELWVYVDGEEGLNNFAFRLKAANTTNVCTISKNLPARQWFKFEVDMSTVTATPEQLANMNIWAFQNNGTYTNKCPIFFDSLNLITAE